MKSIGPLNKIYNIRHDFGVPGLKMSSFEVNPLCVYVLGFWYNYGFAKCTKLGGKFLLQLVKNPNYRMDYILT